MVWVVGFRYLPQRLIEEQKAMYSENTPVVLPLNPGSPPVTGKGPTSANREGCFSKIDIHGAVKKNIAHFSSKIGNFY